VLVIGVTAKDKGTQLEALVRTELISQGYESVHTNVIGPGGNELDVVSERDIGVMGSSRVIPLLCEAKAHVEPIDMPAWQKFLGKVFIERTSKPATIGMLVALNGVNGNVRGSFESIRGKDEGIFVFDGNHLLARAREAGEIAAEDTARNVIEADYRRRLWRLEPAYYGGGYFWIVWWDDDHYSVVAAHGDRLPADEIERLRGALEGSLRGNLQPAEEVQAVAEARHRAKVALLNSLLRGVDVSLADAIASDAVAGAVQSLLEEPFMSRSDHLRLRPADELNAAEVGRLFISLFEYSVPVREMDFVAGGFHHAYVQRLVDTLSERQAGFTLSEEDETELRAIAPLFPSVWVSLARPIPMITSPRANDPELASESMLATDRSEFWDAIIQAVREDFTNVFLRGLLYDHLHVAELAETTRVTVKSKSGVVGTMESETRTAIRQLEEGFASELGSKHALIRMLPSVAEPWDDPHPDPIPLDGL